MVGKRKRNRRDSLAAPPGSKELEVCYILTLAIARSMVSSPTRRACREIYWAGRTGSSYEGLRAQWAVLPIPEVVAYTWCTVCAHLLLWRPPRGALGLSAHAGWLPWYRCADKVDGPWTHGQYLRFRTRALGVGRRRGWRLLPECVRASASASAYCTVPAAVPSARAHSRSLSVSASTVLPRKSPRRP